MKRRAARARLKSGSSFGKIINADYIRKLKLFLFLHFFFLYSTAPRCRCDEIALPTCSRWKIGNAKAGEP